MTTTAKIGIALVIILVVIMLGWTWFNNSMPKADEVASSDAVVAQITPTPTPQLPNTAGMGMSEEKDLSVEAIQTDIDAVGKQMTELGSDTAGIDYGLNIVIK